MAYVLIVDDDADFADAAASALRVAGHEVGIALDTATAVTSMEQRCPDLAILDVMFPEDAAAGFEFARTMRQHGDELKGVPVLMLTAINMRLPLGFSSKDIDDTWLPVSDFLEKPVELDVLRSKVAELLVQADSKSG